MPFEGIVRRRTLLQMMAATCFLGPLQLQGSTSAKRLLSCRKMGDQHYLTAFTLRGDIMFDLPLPGRGHGILQHPSQGECALVARRPGEYLWIVDLQTGQPLHKISSKPGYHYYGHAAYNHQGSLLFVVENQYEDGQGIIGVYDARDRYQRIGELSSHGIGPHELKLLRDDKTIVVANGGIQTHPDSGRSQLNVADMKPSLVYLDSDSGKLLGEYRPPQQWHQLSIRHLDLGANDQVCVGMQFQGAKNLHPPVIAMHQGQDQLQFINAPGDLQKQLRNYIGSVAVDRSGNWFALSAPRGNRIVFLSTLHSNIESLEVVDGCGVIAADQSGEFYVSSGVGSVYQYQAGGNQSSESKLLFTKQGSWDNHLS